jgi:hypothetical protein
MTPDPQPLAAARLEEIDTLMREERVLNGKDTADLRQHITSLTAQLAEARKDSERLDWLEAHRHVSLRHWTNGCIVELFDEKYWHDRHNQRDERFCDNYRQLLDHQLKDAAQRGEKGSKI